MSDDNDARPLLRLGHSPDPDDAFMWWPLFEIDGQPPRIDTGRFRFEPVLADIETLNRRSEQGELEITAMSCAQYPKVRDRYALTSCGASLGEAYGPKLVSREPMRLEELRDERIVIAIPGERTSAFATLCLLLGKGTFRYEEVPFEQIIDQVAGGKFAAGLIIHEGQLTYEQAGLHLIEDLGQWWWRRTGLPLPLGVNTVRRDLESRYGSGTLAQIAGLLYRSVQYALAHREEGVGYALVHARGLERRLADHFIVLYVNKWTLDFGPQGQAAVRAFLAQTSGVELAENDGAPDFIEPECFSSKVTR